MLIQGVKVEEVCHINVAVAVTSGTIGITILVLQSHYL